MKLYSIPASPYGARVALQIALKELDIPVETSPWPLRSEDFNRRFVLRKLPILVLDNGESIGDSWAIVEYLEQINPAAALALRPTEALALAQMHLMARYTDTHLGPQGLFPLFKTQLVPGSGDPATYLPDLLTELAKGERLLRELPIFHQRDLHLGDLALAPVIVHAIELLHRFGGSYQIGRFPMLCEWYEFVREKSAARNKLDELHLETRSLLDKLQNKT